MSHFGPRIRVSQCWLALSESLERRCLRWTSSSILFVVLSDPVAVPSVMVKKELSSSRCLWWDCPPVTGAVEDGWVQCCQPFSLEGCSCLYDLYLVAMHAVAEEKWRERDKNVSKRIMPLLTFFRIVFKKGFFVVRCWWRLYLWRGLTFCVSLFSFNQLI